MIRVIIFAILITLNLRAEADPTVSCVLEDITIEVDADGDVHRSYANMANLTITKSDKGNYAEAFNADRFFVSARYYQGQIRMFIRDKKNLTAAESNQPFVKSSELMLSDPGAYTEPGLRLTCTED